jgi:hypothetical protein
LSNPSDKPNDKDTPEIAKDSSVKISDSREAEVQRTVDLSNLEIKDELETTEDGWDKPYFTKFYGKLQSDHQKVLAKYMGHDEFVVLYNNIKVPDNATEAEIEDKLIFETPQWVKATLIHSPLSGGQWDFLRKKKIKIDEITKNSGITLRQYIDKNIPLPENYATMFTDKEELEKSLYSDGLRICFKIKVLEEDPRPITKLDYLKLNLDQMKLAIDSIIFRYENPQVKKAKT